MQRWNSARRLFELGTQVQATNVPEVVLLWASVFGINPEAFERPSLVIEVAARLVWVHEEIDRMEDYFRLDQEYPEDLYLKPAQRFRNAASPILLNAGQDVVKKQINAEVLLGLKHLAQTMPSTEVPLKAEDIQTFERLVAQLDKTASQSELDPRLAGVLHRHARLMQRAIDAYPIFGVRAFDDAVRDGSGEMFLIIERAKADSASEAERTAVDEAVEAWRTIGGKMEAVRKGAELLLTAGKIAEFFISKQ